MHDEAEWVMMFLEKTLPSLSWKAMAASMFGMEAALYCPRYHVEPGRHQSTYTTGR